MALMRSRRGAHCHLYEHAAQTDRTHWSIAESLAKSPRFAFAHLRHAALFIHASRAHFRRSDIE